MLIPVQPNPSWQLSLAQLSPSLFQLMCYYAVKPQKLSFVIMSIHKCSHPEKRLKNTWRKKYSTSKYSVKSDDYTFKNLISVSNNI